MKDLYRLVYTSLNLLEGSEAERKTAVAEILAVSQRNNGKVGVTGALMFNGGSFAQVLEGPRKAVESTFERIQRDRRHSEVNVLQCVPVECRGFTNWSMAFVGQSARGRAMWNEIAEQTGFDLRRIEGDALFATLQAIVIAEEEATPSIPAPAQTASPPASNRPAPRRDPLDMSRVRAELLDRSDERRATMADTEGHEREPKPSNAAQEILRAALDEERGRTTDLRRSLDDTQVELATVKAELAALQRKTTRWAEQARELAAFLHRDPSPARNTTDAEPMRVAS